MQDHYSAELDRKPYEALSNKALTTLLGDSLNGSQDAWKRLWEHGLRMVLKVANGMQEAGTLQPLEYAEAVAVGNAAIGEALLEWRPRLGKYSTWIWVSVRRAIERAVYEERLVQGHISFDEELSEILDETFMAVEDEEFSGREGQVLALIETLPDNQGQAVYLHFYQGMTQSEIGNILGVTRQRVNQLIDQGVVTLRKSLNIHTPQRGIMDT